MILCIFNGVEFTHRPNTICFVVEHFCFLMQKNRHINLCTEKLEQIFKQKKKYIEKRKSDH